MYFLMLNVFLMRNMNVFVVHLQLVHLTLSHSANYCLETHHFENSDCKYSVYISKFSYFF